MFRDAGLVAAKDLRIELRSRVATNQVLPFALVVLVLFAFALDPDSGVLSRTAPGLFWVAVLFTTVVAVQRAAGLEVGDGGLDALRLSGLDPAGIFLGKAAALAVQLVALEAVLLAGVVVFYDARVDAGRLGLLVATMVAATVGLSSAGTVYGALSAGLRSSGSLLPLLLLPVLAPLLIGATRTFESALRFEPAVGSSVASAAAFQRSTGESWPWVGLLSVFAAVYVVVGLVAYGPLLEES